MKAASNWRVFVEADGTATPDADYPRLPISVTIPAGTNAARVLVVVSDDLLAEGPEVVRVRIDRPPELATLGYLFNVHASQAYVVIGDDETNAPQARLDFLEPREGAEYAASQPIALEALGVFTRGEVDREVEFYSDGVLIGRSTPPALGRPTIPCLPNLHTFTWTNPPPGRHTLTARSEISLNTWVEAPPVHIIVEPDPSPVLEFLEPTRNALFSTLDEIPIMLRAFASNDLFLGGEVFANGVKIADVSYCCWLCPCAHPTDHIRLGKPKLSQCSRIS